MNVRSVLSDAARTWPDRTAIIDDHGSMTFAELETAVDALESQLAAAGIGARQGLGVIAKNGRGFVVAVFAGLGVGATVMPISNQLKPAEITSLLEVTPLHAVLDDGTAPSPGIGGQPTQLGSWNLVRRDIAADEPLVPHVPDAAFVRYTSGTTGTSKGVVISHASVLGRTEAARESLSITADDTVLWVLPMAYHFVVTIVMYVRYGVTISVADQILAASLIERAERDQTTLLYAAPTHYRMLAAERSQRRMPTLRMAISTCAAMPADVAETFLERMGLPISQIYGIIEIGLPAGNLDSAEGPDTIGRPLAQHEVAILDDAGKPVPQGTVGRLAMRGPGMFDAYLSPPRMRDEVLEDGWFMTGDLALLRDDGRIQVAGREKSMINRGGLKVFPEEVEAVLDGHPGVAAVRVYGVPHALLGEVVKAEVVAAPAILLDTDELRQFCRTRLTAYKVPQWIVQVDAIARTGSGKVKRHGAA